MKPSLALIGVFSSLWGVACGVFISTGLPTPIRTGMGVALALLGWVTGFVFGYARGHRRAILHLTSHVSRVATMSQRTEPSFKPGSP